MQGEIAGDSAGGLQRLSRTVTERSEPDDDQGGRGLLGLSRRKDVATVNELIGMLLAADLTIEQKARALETIIDAPPPHDIPPVVHHLCGHYTKVVLNAVQLAEAKFREETDSTVFFPFSMCFSYNHVFVRFRQESQKFQGGSTDKPKPQATITFLLAVKDALNTAIDTSFCEQFRLMKEYYFQEMQSSITRQLMNMDMVAPGKMIVRSILTSVRNINVTEMLLE
jgi:hypothetical protein